MIQIEKVSQSVALIRQVRCLFIKISEWVTEGEYGLVGSWCIAKSFPKEDEKIMKNWDESFAAPNFREDTNAYVVTLDV